MCVCVCAIENEVERSHFVLYGVCSYEYYSIHGWDINTNALCPTYIDHYISDENQTLSISIYLISNYKVYPTITYAKTKREIRYSINRCHAVVRFVSTASLGVISSHAQIIVHYIINVLCNIT